MRIAYAEASPPWEVGHMRLGWVRCTAGRQWGNGVAGWSEGVVEGEET